MGGGDGFVGGADVEETDYEEDGREDAYADEVGLSTADIGHDAEPGDEGSGEAHGCSAYVEVVCSSRRGVSIGYR